jgi:hypothetical protein
VVTDPQDESVILPEFHYFYTVDGEYYGGQFCTELELNEAGTGEALDSAQVGQPIKVRYNQRNPGQSRVLAGDNPKFKFEIL